jgi:hypothetical protein
LRPKKQLKELWNLYSTVKKSRTANSRFAKAVVAGFYDSETLNSSFVYLMKFSAKNPPLRQAVGVGSKHNGHHNKTLNNEN